MTTIWNPQALLGVDPRSERYTCRGTTKKGKRCRNPVKNSDRTRATRMLDTLAYHPPTSTTVEDDLQEIAELCLCKRLHRGTQVEDIVTDWTDVIAESFLRRGRTEDLSYSSTGSRTESTSSRYARSLAPSPESLTRVSTRSASSRTSEESIQSRPNATPPQHSRHSSTSTPPSEDVPHINHTHEVMRRPITDACGVCYEAIHSLEDAVWCRAECGQNIHRECWDLWSAEWHSQRSDANTDEEEQPSCVFCRAPWVEAEATSSPEPEPMSSRTSSSTHTHSPHEVTRRPITDDCVICFDAIQNLEDAVWCRGQCGHNVHSHCWGRWSREHSSNRSAAGMNVDTPPTCVLCRAPWVD